MVDPMERDMLKAFAVGNTSRARELNEVLPDSQRESYHSLVSALFAVLLEKQFTQELSRDAIAGFVNQMREDYRTANPPIKPLVIEGVIRAAVGEDYFLDEIAPEDILSAQYQVIGKIVGQQAGVSANIDHYLDEAEQVLAEWEAEDAQG